MKKTLYTKDSKDRIRIWNVDVVKVSDGATIRIQHGLLDGTLVSKSKTVTEGKNIGKANETTPLQQAESEALSAWQNQKDTGYFETVEEAQNTMVYLPMLAHRFDKRKHNITYPAYVQPKLDGVRCLAKKVSETEIHFMSRGGKDYDTMQRHPVKDVLLKDMQVGEIKDGEIYKHGWSLQKITSAVKKYKENTMELEYWIYDRAIGGTFEQRFVTGEKSAGLKYLETHVINSEADVQKWHDEFVKQGYEGVIIRNANGLYKFGSRSADLQKYKQFIDDEFEIVGWGVEEQSINGVAYRCIVYSCVTKDGATFNCRPRGSLTTRGEMLKVADELVGKYLTVRYQALTDDTEGKGRKVPQFPVGICVRDYE